MTTDEQQIRALVERWTDAAHVGDLDAVLADHADDIVMFDVPPPHQGVRGIDAYRETWPPFFEWQAQGAVFEIESLDVEVGGTIAFAHALLRCGMPQDLARNPGNRLRLTLGLRHEQGRWVVAHEHHSFALADTIAAERDVRALHERWFDATSRKDLDELMSGIADDVVSYEHEEPLRRVGVDEVREVCKRGLDASSGAVGWHVPDLTIEVRDDIAVAWGLNHLQAELPDGTMSESWSRGTRVFQRRGDDWLLIHQHVSFPYDPATGEVRTSLRP